MTAAYLPIRETTARLPRHPYDVEGYGSPECWELLYEVACGSPLSSVIVELGTYKGQGLVCLAQSGRFCYGVDHFSGEPYLPAHALKDHLMGDYRQALDEAIEAYGLSNVHIIDADTHSQEAVDEFFRFEASSGREFMHQEIGLLVIDAAHDIESVRADFAAWSPLVRPDGAILLDDIDHDGPGQFLTELPDGWQLHQKNNRYALLKRAGEQEP